MTKLEPKMVTMTLPLLDLRGNDGQEVSVGSGHIELTLRTAAMRGLRLLIHGMRASGGELTRKATHKKHAIEELLAQVGAAYDSEAGKESKKSNSGRLAKA